MAKKLQMCGTEDEMREVAAKICKNYLHGAWKSVDPDDFHFRKLSGGLSNFLYLIGLPDHIETKSVSYHHRDSLDQSSLELVRSSSFAEDEPKMVLLRIYGQIHGERAMDAIVTESVIFTLLSERKLGPKLYGVFSGGRIEEYIPARPLLTKELADPALSMKIAEKMAAIHSMAVPLSKDPDWIWKTAYKWLKTVKEDRASGKVTGKTTEEQHIIKIMNAMDFDTELAWLRKYLSVIDSPVVFCHNDMQEGNILLFDDTMLQANPENYSSNYLMNGRSSSFEDDANTSDSINSRLSDSGEPRIVFIDFEYCAYNHRGFDIANHFQEWSIDYTNPTHPFYYVYPEDAPTLEQKEIFIKSYLKHYHINVTEEIQELAEPTVDQINQLLAEVDAYSLSSNLLWTLWSCVNASKSTIPFGYWEYAQTRLDTYYRQKQEVIKKGNGVAQKRKIYEVDL